VNLLPGPREEPRAFAPLVGESWRQLQERLRGVMRLGAGWSHVGRDGRYEAALEELEEAPSFAGLQGLLTEIESERAALLGLTSATSGDAGGASSGPVSADLAPRGAWLVHRPGLSLETGEAEIASRGLFDVSDRPPLGLWISAIARPLRSGRPGFESAVLAWIPPTALEAARSGRRACPNGSLVWPAELSQRLAEPLASLLDSPLPPLPPSPPRLHAADVRPEARPDGETASAGSDGDGQR